MVEKVSAVQQPALSPEEIGTLFHGILFAYQKSIRDIMGTGYAVFMHPILDIIKKISENTGINLIKGRNLDEVFENLSKVMPTTGLVREFRFEKIAPKKYSLHVGGCVWAPHIHSELNPVDVICPYALLAMSIFQEVSKSKVGLVGSEYYKNGTKTKIEPLM